MCNKKCIDFGMAYLKKEDVKGKSVLEVGSLDVNGSLRSVVAPLGPSSYIGVDIQTGRGVDQICRAENLVSAFGGDRFDVVMCTELIEHVKDWRKAIHNLKMVLKPGGTLLVTTRSRGKEYHGYPFDFWRYEVSDMMSLFADLDIMVLEKDAEDEPGVLLYARKPESFIEKTPRGYKLYSMPIGGRSSVIANAIYWIFVCVPLRKLFGKRKWISTLKK